MMQTGIPAARWTTVDPATGATLAEYAAMTEGEVDAALDRLHAAFGRWRATPAAERMRALRNLGAALRAAAEPSARTIAREMGKPIRQARAEVEKCARTCDWFAEHAEAMLRDEAVATEAQASYVGFRPLGAVLAVMPWNFPFWQVFRALVPALAAGNVLVLKHASNVTGCALAIREIVAAAGLPDGVVEVVLLPGSAVLRLVADPRIAAVTLTGSEAAGRAIGRAAGDALKKSVLELGGSDAFVVLADADLDAAAAAAATARFQNTGQSCIAGKRFIVEAPVYDAFAERFVAATRALRVGDPQDEATDVGPMARVDLRDELAEQIERARGAGAQLALGGERGAAAYLAPTILADVVPGMSVFDEETFGPAAALVRARDPGDALRLANASEFGLAGSLWTRDLERARVFAAQVESGAVYVNAMAFSDPRLPFGGVKRSGYGRELSAFGLREFVNVQTVWIA